MSTNNGDHFQRLSKRPQAARYLMEVADLARGQYNPDIQEKEESTTELMFRIKQKMKKEPVAITDNEEASETNNA